MDLSHVFCERSAGTAIKGYSPELIVHPVLVASEEAANPVKEGLCPVEQLADTGAAAVKEWIPRLDALLVGPGLGRNRAIVLAASHVLIAAAERGIPILLDADGLFILSSALRPGDHIPAPVAGRLLAALAACPVTLTPNRVEFERLCQALGLAERGSGSFERRAELAPLVARAIGEYAIVVAKGGDDVISDGATTIACSAEGSPRRCGGQGDVLAGLLLAMRAWADIAIEVPRARRRGRAAGAGLPAAGPKTGDSLAPLQRTIPVHRLARPANRARLNRAHGPRRLTAGRRRGRSCGGAGSTGGSRWRAPSPRAFSPAGEGAGWRG